MKIGDYVKTKSGYICKIININDFREPSMKYGVEVSSISDVVFMGDEDIIKSSPNIIDLIEVGDYVNGYRVIEATPNDKRKKQQITIGVDYQEYGEDYLENKDIKSVITKGQFESMEYKL